MLHRSSYPLVAALLVAGIFQARVTAQEANLKGGKPLPDITLPAPAKGRAALEALGQHLPAVANAHGMTAGELARIFAEDHTTFVDRKGRLFYVEPDLPAPEGASTVTPDAFFTTSTAIPLENTFLLHSRPGAAKIIYLDFDGHSLAGAGWNANYNGGNAIQCPAWDTDGNPAVFGDAERAAIQKIWKRVAEDYAAFNVDVTTEYPGEALLTRSASSDTSYGMRVLISPISSYFGNYGGIAYVGAFDDVGDYYKPALVFPENLANGEKYIAEACAHECGHTLGLSHDGTTSGTTYYAGSGSGATGWAPIMGNGYYQNLTEWSKGEYAGANNTQDDLAIIAGYLGYMADDHGNTPATATVLPAGSQIDVLGNIERNSDVDVFKFSAGAGAITLNIAQADLGPNLDATVSLFDSAGTLVAVSNPIDLLGCAISVAVNAGTYCLQVGSTGRGDPLSGGYSSYASVGRYSITGTVVDPSGTVPPVAVIAAAPASGDAPLSVQFSSSGSADPDGTIVSYSWSFGDGSTSTEANPAHVFAAVGVYTVTLTVRDNSGYQGSSSTTVNALSPNNPPVARLAVSTTSGTAPVTTTLDGSGSTDAEGGIASYQWTFGDGTSGSGQAVQHTYQAPGSFTATLKVTDARGASSTASTVIQVAAAQLKSIRVAAITLTVVNSSAGKYGKATVAITDEAGSPISGATVTGSWSGPVTGVSTGTTDAGGGATLVSKRAKRAGTVVFTVTNVSAPGCAYNSSLNLATSKQASF
jgi:PKD repeat protein